MDNFDDIPIAVRETRPQKSSGRNRRIFWIAGLSAATVGLLGGALAALSPLLTRQNVTVASVAPQAGQSSTKVTSTARETAPAAQGFVEVTDANPLEAADGEKPSDNESILGHFPYEEISSDQLKAIAPGINLASAAADAYRKMENDALADGVRLIPLSGFRSKVDQEYLFFEVKGARGQTAKERAKVSAPPGHSEHHTGYALDMGDGDVGPNLTESFEETRAFKWLEQNAPYYSFELSFPRGNEQGVSYEPWHWRYVGNQESLEIFHKGR